MVSNLVVEIAIYNFDLFHTALVYMKMEMWTVGDGVFCDMVLDDECQGN